MLSEIHTDQQKQWPTDEALPQGNGLQLDPTEAPLLQQRIKFRLKRTIIQAP